MRVFKGFPEPTHVLTHVTISELDTQKNNKSPDLSGLFLFPDSSDALPFGAKSKVCYQANALHPRRTLPQPLTHLNLLDGF